VHTIGAVGYLNALPLIHGLQSQPSIRLQRRVPAELLAALETDQADIALCPVIDFQKSQHELSIVPAGAIGAHSRALTVRVFSRRPIDRIDRVAVDVDSHTSVALLQVVFARLFDRKLELTPLNAGLGITCASDIQSALLIGDKVVTREPSRSQFPHQLDLGQAWRDLTGLPFVFATWMSRHSTDLGPLPELLETARHNNLANLEQLTPSWARAHGWTTDLALTYLRDLLDYEIGPDQLQSIRLFWKECVALGLINHERPLRLYNPTGSEPAP
jgi:chorismate dehydratase